jgi:hypothetical protein
MAVNAYAPTTLLRRCAREGGTPGSYAALLADRRSTSALPSTLCPPHWLRRVSSLLLFVSELVSQVPCRLKNPRLALLVK